VPGATAVTNPLAETVAIVDAEVSYVTDCKHAFNGEYTGVSCALLPSTIEIVLGVRVTELN